MHFQNEGGMTMYKKMGWIICVLLLAVSAGACGKQEPARTAVETAAPTETESAVQQETSLAVQEEEETEVFPEGQMRSYLTGEMISEEIGKKRPYAIMINNISESLPQSGISQAEVIYEAKVEGGITRLMALFQDSEQVKKIGSIRSARHYYIDFAKEYEAIYVHFGQSKFAKARIEEDKLKTISGLSTYGGKIFYRSKDRVAPHNVYTSGELLEGGLSYAKVTRDYPDGYKNRFKYNEQDTAPAGGEDALRVDIPFDSKPYFTYDEASSQYLRFQYGNKHIDRENDQQLAFKNIIVQYVEEKKISNEDHQDLKLVGKGKGYYITDGKAVKIKWKKAGENNPTVYYDEDDNEIKLNPGKTFFEMVPDDTQITIS